MNNEDMRSAPVMINIDQEIVTGKKAANIFVNSYEKISNISVSEHRKQQVHHDTKNHQGEQDLYEYMNRPFVMKEFEEALSTLKTKKSPDPDKVTNEMLEHLDAKAKSCLLYTSPSPRDLSTSRMPSSA